MQLSTIEKIPGSSSWGEVDPACPTWQNTEKEKNSKSKKREEKKKTQRHEQMHIVVNIKVTEQKNTRKSKAVVGVQI